MKTRRPYAANQPSHKATASREASVFVCLRRDEPARQAEVGYQWAGSLRPAVAGLRPAKEVGRLDNLLAGGFQGSLPNDLSQARVHYLRSGEYFGDIGLKEHDVRSFRITTRVLSADRLREIVIAFHRALFGFTRFLLHKTSVPASLPAGH